MRPASRKSRNSLRLLAIGLVLFSHTAFTQVTEKKLLVNGVEREYIVYAPTHFDADQKHPLILAFHGGGGNAKQTMGHYGFNAVADTAGFLVVYPNGIKKGWNDGRNLKKHTHDDIAFIRQLIQQLKRDYSIDESRIFSTGISNGGFFSFALALRMPDQIKAIAPVCATISMNLYKEYQPANPVSLLLINGTDDPLVPYNGGTIGGKFFDRGQCSSTDNTLAKFISLNQCEVKPSVTFMKDGDPTDNCRAERFIYTCTAAKVQLIKVHGGGHTWPGGKQYLGKRLVGVVCRDFSAAQEIWKFFRQF
jgi:polyhydroxybutyrate depolymerase